MEKEQNQNPEIKSPDEKGIDNDAEVTASNDTENEIKEKKPEEIILELEDKLTRTFAEMENQRRRFEKEKDDAFEYGGFSFAKL